MNMNNNKIKVEFWGESPKHETKISTGRDIKSSEDKIINPGETVRIKTNLFIKNIINESEYDLDIQLRPRSSMNAKGCFVAYGTIDADYISKDGITDKEIQVVMYNGSSEVISIAKGNKIAQLVIGMCFIDKDECLDNIREGGFGSTGK